MARKGARARAKQRALSTKQAPAATSTSSGDAPPPSVGRGEATGAALSAGSSSQGGNAARPHRKRSTSRDLSAAQERAAAFVARHQRGARRARGGPRVRFNTRPQVRVFSVKAAVDGTTFDRKGRPRVQGGRRRRSSSASAASGTDSTEEHKGATAEGDSDASPRSVAPEAAPQDVPEPETPDIDQAGSASFNDGSGSHTTAATVILVSAALLLSLIAVVVLFSPATTAPTPHGMAQTKTPTPSASPANPRSHGHPTVLPGAGVVFPAATQPVALPQHSFVLPGTAAESSSSGSGGGGVHRTRSGTVVFPTSPDNMAEPRSHRLAVPARKIGDLTGANVDASGSVKLGAAEPGRAVHKGSPHDVHATPDAAPPASPSAQPTQRTGQSLPQVPSTPRRRQDAGKRSAKHTRRKRGQKSKRKSRTSANKRRKKDKALAAPTVEVLSPQPGGVLSAKDPILSIATKNFKAKETGSMAVLVNNHFHPLPAAYEGGPLRLQGLTPGRVQLDFILLDSVEATATAPVLAHAPIEVWVQ